MKLDEMYLGMEEADKLFEKLEKYNAEHPEETITAQQLSKKLLIYAIKYLDLDSISLDYL